MSNYTCGRCLFAEEAESSDLIWCIVREEHRKVNDYPCAKWKDRRGLEDDRNLGW